MTTVTYEHIWHDAQRLSLTAQIRLAEALLHNVRAVLADAADTPLSPLTGLSEAELHALADAIVAPQHQAQLRQRLAENRTSALTAEAAAELDELLDEVDQVALLKARALYSLQLRGQKS